MTKKISLTAAKIKAARVASIYRISCLVIVAVLVVPTLSVFGQGLTLDDYRALKGTQPVLAKGFQQNRVYHTNGTLWNSWDNLGNTGDISCSAVVPGFTYPGGTVLNYLCRGGYWIVAKSNTANGLVNAAGEASTYLEGTTGEYVLTRGTIAGDISEGWATEMDPAKFPPNDYSQEPWISKVEWHTAAGLKVVATRYSWSFPGKTNNYFLIGSPTEYFDFNDFIIDDITLTYDGDLDGDGVPDANAVATLDQVTLGVKADHDCVWNIGPAGFLENFWDDDGVDYDEETFTTFEFDGDRTTTSEDDTGIDDPLREWRGIHIGRTWIESPDVQLFANGSLMTFPGNTISHYWWTGENDPQNAAKRFAFTTAVFNSENEALSTDFTFDPTLSGDLKTQNPPVTDMRYMQAYGPWVMNKGESVTVVTAILAGAGLENAKNASRAARQAYNWGYNLPKPPPAPMMRHDQIEVTADLTVRVYWENPNEGAIDPDLGRADFAGYRVYRSQISPQSESREILEREGAGLPSNIAESKSFAGDTGGPYRVIKEIPKSDLSTYVSGNGYSYEDADVILGFDYWYYVAAYDDGDPTMTNWQGTPLPNGLPSLESYRTMNYPLDPELGIPTSPRKITVAADAVTSAKFEDKDPPVIPVPNPWRPGGPKSTVVFTGLPADATIKIFDVSGNLVQTIEHQSSISSAEWDLLSRSRTQVVAGIYYYRVEDNTNGKVQFGKLMVIR